MRVILIRHNYHPRGCNAGWRFVLITGILWVRRFGLARVGFVFVFFFLLVDEVVVVVVAGRRHGTVSS